MDLADYRASSGRLVPVWTIEVQTLPEDPDGILDSVMRVHPLSFGRYQRNASISIERDLETLAKVMDAIIEVHHYEEPVIFVRDDWASRANYNPNSGNPHRWWNNGRGLPERLD